METYYLPGIKNLKLLSTWYLVKFGICDNLNLGIKFCFKMCLISPLSSGKNVQNLQIILL